MKNTSKPPRSADGRTVIKDGQGIMERWPEYFQLMLSTINLVDNSLMDGFSLFPQIQEMDAPLELAEIEHAVPRLKDRKSPGPDGIPAKIL